MYLLPFTLKKEMTKWEREGDLFVEVSTDNKYLC